MSTAREPYEFAGGCWWVIPVSGAADEPEYLLPDLFHLLRDGFLVNPLARFYPTRAAALAALADAERRAGVKT